LVREGSGNVFADLGYARPEEAAAKAIGQHVTLPHASANSEAVPAKHAVNARPEKGKVNVTA
jgi:hypothetical protein